MTTGADVLEMLLPNGGWISYGDDYENIQFIECEPITKAEYEAGFAQYEVWKAQQKVKAEDDKASAQAKLAALGLTTDDLKALGL
jgi:hypothetical protein